MGAAGRPRPDATPEGEEAEQLHAIVREILQRQGTALTRRSSTSFANATGSRSRLRKRTASTSSVGTEPGVEGDLNRNGERHES